MKKTVVAVMLAAAALSCRHLAYAPALFPVTTVWTAPLDDIIEGPLASDGMRIFVATREGSVRAFDPSGAQLWRIDGPPAVVAAAAGLLVLRQSDGTLRRLDPESGAPVWASASGIAGTAPPALAGDRILVAGDGLAAVDIAAGRVLWSVPAPPKVTTPPVASGPWVLAGEEGGTLRCRDRATGVSLWTAPTAATLQAAPVVDPDGRVLVGTRDRRFMALDAAKGRGSWRWKVGADIQNGAAVLGAHVLFATFEDVLYALKRGNGHMAWRAPLPSRPASGPILVGDSVLLACYETEILGFEGRTGKRLGGLKTPAEIRTPPLLVGDRLYIGLRDRSIVAYTLDMTIARPLPTPPPAPKRDAKKRTQPGVP